MTDDIEAQEVTIPSAHDKFTCGICYDDYELKDVKFLEKCKHKFCKECFTEFYRSMIEDQFKHGQLKCPEYGCGTRPTKEEIESIISSDCFAKYLRFERNAQVISNKNLIYCSTQGCEEVLDVREADKKSKKLKCQECGKNTCPSCKQAYHGKKLNCQKKIESQLKDALTGVDFHKCPSCGTVIEKNGGCPQMHCSICQYRWCWICGLHQDSLVHLIQVEGIVCLLINETFFGFGWQIHWLLRLPLSFVCFLLSPIALVILVGVLPGVYVYKEHIEHQHFQKWCCCRCLDRVVKFFALCLVYLLLFPIGAVVGAILVTPYLILVLFLIIRITWRFGISGEKKSLKIKKKQLQRQSQVEKHKKAQSRRDKLRPRRRGSFESYLQYEQERIANMADNGWLGIYQPVLEPWQFEQKRAEEDVATPRSEGSKQAPETYLRDLFKEGDEESGLMESQRAPSRGSLPSNEGGS